MRSTTVNNCGLPATGADSHAVGCGFVTIGLTANIDEGNAIQVRTAAGVLCVNEPACRALTGYDVSVDFCEVDPEMFELMTSSRLLTDYAGNSVGFAITEDIECETGFGLEVWSQVAGQDSCSGTGSWWYWLIPFISSGIIGGDLTIEDGPVTFSFSGSTKSGSAWGQGPYNVVWTAASTPGKLLDGGVGSTDHLYARTVEVEPPDCVCGYAA